MHKKFRIPIAYTSHDGKITIPTGEREFPLLVRWNTPTNKLVVTISTSFLTFHKIKHSCPWYVCYWNWSMSHETLPLPFGRIWVVHARSICMKVSGSGVWTKPRNRWKFALCIYWYVDSYEGFRPHNVRCAWLELGCPSARRCTSMCNATHDLTTAWVTQLTIETVYL